MFLLDFIYLVYLAPALALAIWAQVQVSSAFAEGSRIPTREGLTGAQAAERVLRAEAVAGVKIALVHGELSDHYDPGQKVLRLSPRVFEGQTLAALGVATHEAGHAIQHARRYWPLFIRNLAVPLAGLGSTLAWVVMLAGLVLQWGDLFLSGILLFSTTVALELVNLPIEFDASRRARQALQTLGLVSP
ncbi:MAG TPA: zinc metallopeptidase, partial [Isosphaeraceae bacterium]|nr:zinc metallopeptidase [Isosphaeraceae bacterium]